MSARSVVKRSSPRDLATVTNNKTAFELLNDYLQSLDLLPLEEYDEDKDYVKLRYWFHTVYDNRKKMDKQDLFRLMYANMLSPSTYDVLTFMKYAVSPIDNSDDEDSLLLSLPSSLGDKMRLVCILDGEDIEDDGIIYDTWKDVVFLTDKYDFVFDPSYKKGDNNEVHTISISDPTLGKLAAAIKREGLYFLNHHHYEGLEAKNKTLYITLGS